MKNKMTLQALMLGILMGVPLAPFDCAQARPPITTREGTQQTEQQTQGQPVQIGTAKMTEFALVVYEPPLRGAPGNRVGGASRGIDDEVPTLEVLAPDHIGLTIQAQPSLYWYISRPTTSPLELCVVNEDTLSTVLDVALAVPRGAGVKHLRLSDYGIKLVPDVEYRWSVTLVADPEHRSRDIIASGTIQRVQPPEGLAQKLSRASEQERPAIYAAEGLWYDALAAISELIENRADDKILRAQRASLMEQVELPAVAAYDRRFEVGANADQ
jgi:Domain of Unknown Function (DUF928).